MKQLEPRKSFWLKRLCRQWIDPNGGTDINILEISFPSPERFR